MIRARETIASPTTELVELLMREQPRWLASFLRLACMEGEQAAARQHGDTVASRPSGPKAAVVELGTPLPQADGDTVIVPIRWRVQGYRILPNRFEGRMELCAGLGQTTDVELYGNWALDPRDHPDFATRLAARSAAEAAIACLLRNVKVALEESAKTTA